MLLDNSSPLPTHLPPGLPSIVSFMKMCLDPSQSVKSLDEIVFSTSDAILEKTMSVLDELQLPISNLSIA